ncbi:MAG: hypothetical protein AAB963_01305, partial [Patescibacteria group bacterium]
MNEQKITMLTEQPAVDKEHNHTMILEKLRSTLNEIILGASNSFIDSNFLEVVHTWHYVNGIDIKVFNNACSDFLNKEKLSDVERQVIEAILEKARRIFSESDEHERQASIEHWRQQSAKEFSEEERVDTLRAYAANLFVAVFRIQHSIEKNKNKSDSRRLEAAK